MKEEKYYEFEATNHMEALNKATNELNCSIEDLSVEVLEETKGGFFKSGKVRIKVSKKTYSSIDSEIANKVISFINKIIELSNCKGSAHISSNQDTKLQISITSLEDAELIIGKKGMRLDAIQVLANTYLSKISDDKNIKVILDSQDYRVRKEDKIIEIALMNANIVKKTKKTRLLNPMNPFERRIVHSALGEMDNIYTESEGNGTIKRVKIMYKA